MDSDVNFFFNSKIFALLRTQLPENSLQSDKWYRKIEKDFTRTSSAYRLSCKMI